MSDEHRHALVIAWIATARPMELADVLMRILERVEELKSHVKPQLKPIEPHHHEQ